MQKVNRRRRTHNFGKVKQRLRISKASSLDIETSRAAKACRLAKGKRKNNRLRHESTVRHTRVSIAAAAKGKRRRSVRPSAGGPRSEEHTSELQSRENL